jgi:hypothetical protein
MDYVALVGSLVAFLGVAGAISATVLVVKVLGSAESRKELALETYTLEQRRITKRNSAQALNGHRNGTANHHEEPTARTSTG